LEAPVAPATNSPDVGLTGDKELETDAGPHRGGGKAARHDQPQRRCIATGERRGQGEMLRFVLSPDGQVTPDLGARLPGRGAWVIAKKDAIELALSKGAFARAFKAQAKTPSDLPAQVESMLAKRALDGLGLAKRAGDLILGYQQVREAIFKAAPACLIEAADGAADGREKVLALALGVLGPSLAADKDERSENQRLPPVIGCFSSEELGMALGRGRVIHACLKQGRFAQNWMGELARLAGFRLVWRTDWLACDERARSGASSGGAPKTVLGAEKIDETQARRSGAYRSGPQAATKVSE
jgi:predicted RNA-binding protein YlxR (DUF448 family)